MNFDIKIIGDKELVLYLQKIDESIKPQIISGLKDVADYLQEKVKDKFGKYQPSWPKLKRASVIAKYRRRGLSGAKVKGGFTLGPDDPLILFGNLKNSIDKEVNNGELEAVVFSDNVYSAVHEYGYKNIPARSYMRTTLDEETEKVIDIIGNKIEKLL